MLWYQRRTSYLGPNVHWLPNCFKNRFQEHESRCRLHSSAHLAFLNNYCQVQDHSSKTPLHSFVAARSEALHHCAISKASLRACDKMNLTHTHTNTCTGTHTHARRTNMNPDFLHALTVSHHTLVASCREFKPCRIHQVS